LVKSFGHISSGLRINSAKDDEAGLAVSENLDTAAKSIKQAQRNTHDALSVIQTAEGATSEVGDILKRIRELAVQSSSETLHNNERVYIQDEYQQLSEEISRIADVTEFNGIALSNNTNSQINVQVGMFNSSDDRVAIQLADLRVTALGVDTGNMSLSSSASAQSALVTLDAALDKINAHRSDFGAVQNRLDSTLNNQEGFTEHMNVAKSRIRDADYAYQTAEMQKYQIMQQAGVAVLGQANGISEGAIRLIG